MNNKFFYYYLAAHLVVFSLLLGLVADAFTVLSGGGISVPPTADSRAVVSNGVIDGVIANATTTAYLKQAKRVAGGCQIWDTGTFWRVQRWGNAVSVNYDLSMTCACPSGFTKVVVSNSSTSTSDVRSGQWYHHYRGTNTNVNTPTKCTTISPTSNHNENINQVDFHTGDELTNLRHCYKKLCNEVGCDCSKEPNDLKFYTEIMSRGTFFNYTVALMNKLVPSARAEEGALGCGLVMMYQKFGLPSSQTSNVQTWACVNTSLTTTITGWDN